MRDESLAAPQPLDFWLSNHVFDETKLWYMVRGTGYRRYSTLAHHSQVTWKDSHGTHDEDIIRAPKPMRKYSAAVQWKCLCEDSSGAGFFASAAERPWARFFGVGTICDSHAVNGLTLKHLRKELPPDHVILPSFCLQHLTGNTASEVSTALGMFTSVWLLSKTLAEGDFHIDLVGKIQVLLEDEECGLEVVDPDDFQLDEGDLGHEFTQEILDRCYKCGLGLGEDVEGGHARFEKVKSDFANFFPIGWNRGAGRGGVGVVGWAGLGWVVCVGWAG